MILNKDVGFNDEKQELTINGEVHKIRGGGQGTTDYSDLDNKPRVNGVTLTGNKSLRDLGITPTVSNETLTFQ